MDVLSHARAELLFDVAVFQMFAESLDGRDVELLVNPQDSLRIKPRVGTNRGDFGTDIGAEFFQLSQRTGQYDLADGAADGSANASIQGEISVTPDELVNAS